MESVWLKEHLEKIQKQQSSSMSQGKKAVIIGVVFAVLIGFILAAGASDPDPTHDTTPVAILMGIAAILIILIILAAGKSNKKIAKPLQENLERILTTPELVNEFDSEMSAKPVFEFDDGSSNSRVFFTEHYIGNSFLNRNVQDYRFARRNEIAELRFSVSRDQSKIHGMGRLYFVDLIGKDGKKVLGLAIHGKERMNQFEEILTKYCPDVKLQQHNLLG